MLWIRWAFLIFNVVACVAALLSKDDGRPLIAKLVSPSSGAQGILDTAGWVYVWQLLGAGLVIWLHASAWHLLWWFVVGWIIAVTIGKLLLRARLRSSPDLD